jgi:glutathione synthase/RimK-type ligase-like ATP-grasp enzyme
MEHNTAYIVNDLVSTIDDIIAINSFDAEKLTEPLQHITNMVYADEATLKGVDKKVVIDTLANMPLSQAQEHYGQQHLNKDCSNQLELIQAICIHAECEHDKHISRMTHDVSDTAIAARLEELPELLSLEQLKQGDAEGTQQQVDTRLAVFYAMRDQYPYRWACARAESETIALEHIIPDGLKDGDTIAYLGSAASPFSAMAMVLHNSAQGTNINTVYVDDDAESATLAKAEIARMERLNVVPTGSISVLEGDARNMPNFQSEIGKIPIIGIVTAAVDKKTEAVTAFKEAGVNTINALSTQGLAELMYSRAKHQDIGQSLPLRAIATPAHIEERLPTGSGVGVIKADQNPEKRFWVTPLFFSKHEWKSDLGNDRVVDPQKKQTFADNVKNHPRRIAPPRKNICIATCAALPNVNHPKGEDHLVTAHLRTKGFNVKSAIWDDPEVDWKRFDTVLIRTAYDYKEKPEAFIQWLEGLEEQNIHVMNDSKIIKKNIHKSYLLELQKEGVNVIPTDIYPKGTDLGSTDLTKEYGWHDVVIKPAVGSGGENAVLLMHGEGSVAAANELLALGDMLVQPFMPEIYQGEHSLMFFGGKFSHAVLKEPNGTEFRVHEKFGGNTFSSTPDAETIKLATDILQKAAPNTTYARVDGIMKDGEFLLMELELIEPWMYLHNAPSPKDAAKRFADAIEAQAKSLRPEVLKNHVVGR